MEYVDEMTVRRCCYCFPLKIGCYLIACCSVLHMVPSTVHEIYLCYDRERPLIKIILFFSGVMLIISIFATFYLLYGLFTLDAPVLGIYMILILIAMALTLLSPLLVTSQPYKADCIEFFPLWLSAVIELLIQSYCLLIINSYRVVLMSMSANC